MKLIPFLAVPLMLALTCHAQEGERKSSPAYRFIVQEVLQANMYTYLKAKNDTMVYWIAIPKKEVKPGDTMYHGGGMPIKNFTSKELNRTFPEIYFMDGISAGPDMDTKTSVTIPQHGKKTSPVKENIRVEAPDGGISLAELFREKEKYAGKVVRVSGKVVKYNDDIMKKNWAHLQDGTSFGDEYDLTVTLLQPLKVGDIITIEGLITLNKDFGSGYFFKILMEEASVLE